MNAKKSAVAKDGSVRDRLVESADQLFYQEGYRAVGIDKVLAQAGAAKASLYAHFGSKDELVAACVERRTLDARTQIEAWVEAVPDSQRALRLFDFLIEWVAQPDFRGCPVQHLVGEYPDPAHPARQLARQQRQWILDRLQDWCTAAGVAESQRTAQALMVLFDGAVAASEQDGPERARDARWAAEQLLARRP